MAADIKVGIVGAGANTRDKHIPGLAAIDGVEIVSVANRSRASGERVAATHGIGTVYDTWRDLVDADDSNAIVIGTWPYLHCSVTLAALAAGKHVLCEARMAMDATEARSMRRAAADHPHLVAQIVPSPMTLGVDRTIQRLLAEEALGEPLAVEVRAGGTFQDPAALMHWRQDADLSGHNVMSMGIWYEAVLRWLGEARTVMAMGRTTVPRRRDAAGVLRSVRVPDHIDVLAELAGGVQLHMQVSAVTGHAGPAEVFLFGSEGTVRFSGGSLFFGGRDDEDLAPLDVPAAERGGWRVEEEFVGAIRGTEPVRFTTFADGLRYMEFTEAVARSRLQGVTVPLPLVTV